MRLYLGGAYSRTLYNFFVVTRAFQTPHMLTSRLNVHFSSPKAELDLIFLLEFLLMKSLLFEFLEFV